MTCGNVTDPRFNFHVDISKRITMLFKSDSTTEKKGIEMTMLEHKPKGTLVSVNMCKLSVKLLYDFGDSQKY